MTTVQTKNIALFWPYISKKVGPAIQQVLDSRWVGQGPLVDKFEKFFESTFSVSRAVAVNSCTSALHLAYILSGIAAGDEVITTPLSCYATVMPLLFQKAKPIFADIKQNTLNIDPKSIEKKITPKTKALLVVDWGGNPCEMDEINEIAKRHQLKVIKDAAHALGAKYKGKPIGSISDFSCFSFQAIKHITSGDGGLLCAKDPKDYEKAKLLRWYGIDRDFKGDIYDKFKVTELGYKYNMTDLEAATLIAQLEDFDQIKQKRKSIVDFYRSNLKQVPGLEFIEVTRDAESANWLFTILVERRADFQKKLQEAGIETSLVHTRLDVYPILGGKRQDLPMMNEIESKYISLPFHCYLAPEDLTYIVDTIRSGW
ncbi:MAG: DegT/DnrJ/EryC1/StrS family aminotransferase [Candidatus Omnitrophica bacterium]|nr:DegT/DnrJ/EryC1/StrS family aminotransferase [Candidatus Omnitrophota bacterium]